MPNLPANPPRYILLSGGVGGAKLALGFDHKLPAGQLCIIANTGDDFSHLGLYVCPDLDTLTYALAKVANPETGWGRADESWSFMTAVEQLGGESWFRLGDKDLATHVCRTLRVSRGESLTDITASFCQSLGIKNSILPMTNTAVPTKVITADGTLAFQEYFVRRQAEPRVLGFEYQDAAVTPPSQEVLENLGQETVAAIVIAPSNPYLSIDPVLALSGMTSAIRGKAPVIAVSPIVGGAAIKGPTAKIMGELGLEVSPVAIAEHYGDLLDGMVIDLQDQDCVRSIEAMGIQVECTATVMKTLADKVSLAEFVMGFAQRIAIP